MAIKVLHAEFTKKKLNLSDLEFVKSLIEGGDKAWKKFYNVHRSNLRRYLDTRYLNILDEVDIEAICDAVQDRLTKNNFKALKEYRGECSLKAYLFKAAEWAAKDWFKANSHELSNEPLDEALIVYPEPVVDESFQVPAVINRLPDDLRQAFLLRHYDYFGFPPVEVRLLAEKTERPIYEITADIAKHFDPQVNGLLNKRKEQHRAFEARLQRLFVSLSQLKFSEARLSNQYKVLSEKKRDQIELKLDKIQKKITAKEKQREIILKNIGIPLTTPYEVIARILGESNVSTIRSRVFKAKKILEAILKNEDV